MSKSSRFLIAGAAVIVVAALLFLWQPFAADPNRVIINGTAVPPVPTLAPETVRLGETIYTAHCAECHGATLEGASNWKQTDADGALPPPPHDSSGHTWHHADSLLLDIITNGGDPAYNSKMPAFKAKLAEDEMIAVLDFIKSKWGQDEREFQWWLTYTREVMK